MTDAVDLACNIKTLAYGEWIDITEGTMFLTCYDCGYSHEQMYKVTGPDMLRVRIHFDDQLTQAAREHNSYALYKEVLALREESMELKRQRKAVLDWIKTNGDPQYHNDIQEILTK